jgi:hypothetical protein
VGTILVPKNYGMLEALRHDPAFYHGTDDQQAADGRHGPAEVPRDHRL